MAGFTQYNAEQIGSALATLASANTDFQDHAQSVTAQYMLLDDTSGGDAVSAGIEFNHEMTTTRQDVSETTEFIAHAIDGSHQEMIETDSVHAQSMGGGS